MKYTHDEDKLRQEALYRFLLSRGGKWTPTERATDEVSRYPTYYTGSYHDSTARRMLSRDIAAINGSDEYDKIILSGNQGIKLATEGEYMRFLGAELKEIFSKLKRVRRMMKKARRDQQMDLEGRIAEAFLGREPGQTEERDNG